MGVGIKRCVDVPGECERMLADAAACKCDVVWLLPDYDRVVERRKGLAASDSPLRFGCTVSTLFAWIEDLWALYGDGRMLVSAVQRKLLVKAVLDDARVAGKELFPASAGRIDLLCSMVQQGAAFGSFDEVASGDDVQLTETQRKMLQVARAYYGELNANGLCEPSEAMRLLSGRSDIGWPAVACESFSALSAAEALFFARISEHASVRFLVESVPGSRFDAGQMIARSLSRAFDLLGASWEDGGKGEVPASPSAAEDALAPEADELCQLAAALYDSGQRPFVRPQGSVRVLLPAGRYAAPSLLADAVVSSDAETVLVACVDPGRMFGELAPRLVERGVSVRTSYSLRFGETDFGEAFLNALDMADMRELRRPDTFCATDYLMGGLSEKGCKAVYSLDEKWRGRRVLDGKAIACDIDECATKYAAPFAGHVGAGDFSAAFDLAECRYVAMPAGNEAFKAEQLAAVSCARKIFEQAGCLKGQSVAEDLRVLLETARVRVRVRASAKSEGRQSVSLMTYREASAQQERSFDAVFACDLNSSEQPVRLRRTSFDALFEALGCEFERDALFETRLAFLRVVRSARERLYLMRILHDADASPLYPAISFEEVMACYSNEVDRATVLAEPFVRVSKGEEPLVFQRGEESLIGNTLRGARPSDQTLEVGPLDRVTPSMVPTLMDPVQVLSPSEIENYLDCPHKWFATRRLRLNAIDAGFTAREKGSFAHAVLTCFYERYKLAYGEAKPRSADDVREKALPLLREVFAALLAEQDALDPFENPLIPITQSEVEQTDELLRHLKGFVHRDAALLPGFEPRRFEYRFGYDEPFEYAGMPLRGSIDRIDIDDKGRAVVVDYKSSLGDSYHLLPADAEGLAELPAKVQALIYAQVVRKLLGCEVVGAVYVHTLKPGSQPTVCGAYDDRILGPDDLPGVKVSRNAMTEAGFRSFDDLLDRVEDMIAEGLSGMAEGNIAVAPRSDRACGFCPVFSCVGRK